MLDTDQSRQEFIKIEVFAYFRGSVVVAYFTSYVTSTFTGYFVIVKQNADFLGLQQVQKRNGKRYFIMFQTFKLSLPVVIPEFMFLIDL